MPTTSTDTDPIRSRRDAAIRQTIAALVGARVFSVACTFIQIPLALRLLGTDGYGFWIALTSATLLLNVADLGLGAGMQNEIGTALAHGDSRRAAMLFFTGATLLTGIAAALLVLGIPVARAIDWTHVFHLSDPTLIAAAPDAAMLTVILFCAGLPLTAGARLANACQWGWLAAIWSAIGSGLQLAAVAAAKPLHLSFTQFVWFVGLAPLITGIGLVVHAVQRLRWTREEVRWAPAADRAGLMRVGLHFSLLQIGATFVFNATAPAIGAVAGTSSVAAYYILQRLLGVAPQLQQMAIGPTWPGYTDAAARHDGAWIRRTFRISLLATIVGVGVPLIATAIFTPAIVHIWTKAQALPITIALTWTVCVWNFALCLSHPPAHLLGGLGQVRRFAYWSIAGNVVSIVAMLLLGKTWGAPGIVAGLIVGFAGVGLPGSFIEARRALHALGEPSRV